MKTLKQTLFFIIAGIAINAIFCSTSYAATAYSGFSLSPSQSSEDNLTDCFLRQKQTQKQRYHEHACHCISIKHISYRTWKCCKESSISVLTGMNRTFAFFITFHLSPIYTQTY